ncbi:MAG: hypothetical protein R3E89_03810 [Thiolinea sp.]
MLWAVWRGETPSLTAILTQNNSLIVMLYSVGYLRLVATEADAGSQPLPTGRLAFIKTLLGVHMLGAVINISILLLVSERTTASGRQPGSHCRYRPQLRPRCLLVTIFRRNGRGPDL